MLAEELVASRSADRLHSGTEIFSPLSPEYSSLPSVARRTKQWRIFRTSRGAESSTAKDPADEMSQSMDERKLNLHAASSSPDLTKSSALRRSTGSLSELADRGRPAEKQVAGRPATSRDKVTSSSLITQVRNSFRLQFSSDSKRRQRRVAKHVVMAHSGEPQLVGLRRLCDDYRTSCLQQNLAERRRSLDCMLAEGAQGGSPAEVPVWQPIFTSNNSYPLESRSFSIESAGGSDGLTSNVEFTGGSNDEDTPSPVFIETGKDLITVATSPPYMGDRSASDQWSDALEESIGSCVTTTSVLSSTADEPVPNMEFEVDNDECSGHRTTGIVPDAAESCASVAAEGLPSICEGGKEMGDVEPVVDVDGDCAVTTCGDRLLLVFNEAISDSQSGEFRITDGRASEFGDEPKPKGGDTRQSLDSCTHSSEELSAAECPSEIPDTVQSENLAFESGEIVALTDTCRPLPPAEVEISASEELAAPVQAWSPFSEFGELAVNSAAEKPLSPFEVPTFTSKLTVNLVRRNISPPPSDFQSSVPTSDKLNVETRSDYNKAPLSVEVGSPVSENPLLPGEPTPESDEFCTAEPLVPARAGSPKPSKDEVSWPNTAFDDVPAVFAPSSDDLIDFSQPCYTLQEPSATSSSDIPVENYGVEISPKIVEMDSKSQDCLKASDTPASSDDADDSGTERKWVAVNDEDERTWL